MPRVIVIVITAAMLSFTGWSAQAAGFSNPSSIPGNASVFGISKGKYPRTPIGVAAATTVQRHPNPVALIQGKPKKAYAQGKTDENKGDDTAYDLQMKLKLRRPIQ